MSKKDKLKEKVSAWRASRSQLSACVLCLVQMGLTDKDADPNATDAGGEKKEKKSWGPFGKKKKANAGAEATV